MSNVAFLLTDPKVSAWVSASAGTGKTKLLIDRLARILLAGSAPHSILCLTYTRAAAGEMIERLHHILAGWHTALDADLCEKLTALLGRLPSKLELERARALAPLCCREPVSIQTLHSFAQMLIKQAGDSRRLIEGHELRTLWLSTLEQTFQSTKHDAAWAVLAQQTTWDRVEDWLWQIYQNRFKWLRVRAYHDSPNSEHAALQALLPAEPSSVRYSFDAEWQLWVDHPFYASFGEKRPWREWATQPHIQHLFLTLKGEPRKRVPPHPLMLQWQEAIAHFYRYATHESWLNTNRALKDLAVPVLQAMEQSKQWHHVWDYSDLLEQAMDTLENNPTTIERLHGQLHHVLVDEAQDTSPEQWAIIRQLVHAFLYEESRTLFVVGDLKQSIYSFQGADPDLFIALEQDFAHHFQGKSWQRATLDASWRSTEPVLKLVDAIFHLHGQGVRLDENYVPHRLTRRDAPGRVVLWPLVEPVERTKALPWCTPPLQEPSTGALAEDIACRIKDILASGEILPSTGAAVRPQDIWVLLTRRGPLMAQIENALMAAGIPTSGADRVDLWEHLLVQDVMALARFILLPADDWSLACLLKSPFVSNPLSEEAFYAACHGRETTLWQRVQEQSPEIAAQLMYWISLWEKDITPSMWFSAVFQANRDLIHYHFGHVADDVMAAFLEEVYLFEQHHAPSLQAFVAQERHDSIKRHVNPDQGVHLTTVHSSKGLQAPIIILADATDSPRPHQDDFVWSYNPPLMALRPTRDHLFLKDLHDQHHWAVVNENRRLFYVALTRAADQLYATGLKREAKNPTWYDLMREALEKLGASDCLSYGDFTVGEPWIGEILPGIPVQHKPQTLQVPRYIREDQRDVYTPEAEAGVILHHWLEVMQPTTNPEVFLRKYDPNGLLTIEQLRVCQSWLVDPSWSWIFAGQAEVDVIDDQGHLRRIDRLVVREHEIWVLDFKTGLGVDQSLAAYRRQMEGYRKALKAIYPHHTIRCCIVRVAGIVPQLMHVN